MLSCKSVQLNYYLSLTSLFGIQFQTFALLDHVHEAQKYFRTFSDNFPWYKLSDNVFDILYDSLIASEIGWNERWIYNTNNLYLQYTMSIHMQYRFLTIHVLYDKLTFSTRCMLVHLHPLGLICLMLLLRQKTVWS